MQFKGIFIKLEAWKRWFNKSQFERCALLRNWKAGFPNMFVKPCLGSILPLNILFLVAALYLCGGYETVTNCRLIPFMQLLRTT